MKKEKETLKLIYYIRTIDKFDQVLETRVLGNPKDATAKQISMEFYTKWDTVVIHSNTEILECANRDHDVFDIPLDVAINYKENLEQV